MLRYIFITQDVWYQGNPYHNNPRIIKFDPAQFWIRGIETPSRSFATLHELLQKDSQYKIFKKKRPKTAILIVKEENIITTNSAVFLSKEDDDSGFANILMHTVTGNRQKKQFSGVHYLTFPLPDFVREFVEVKPPDKNGVYIATFKIFSNDRELIKENESTMFPKDWSLQKLSRELIWAYKFKKPDGRSETTFESSTYSGVPVTIVTTAEGKFRTIYPRRIEQSYPLNQEQHRISQVYLRQWSFRDMKSNAETICVMKSDDPVTHYKRVKSFTKDVNLFDTPILDSERFFEMESQKVESNYPSIISKLKDSSALDDLTRTELVKFVANIFIRQKSTIELLKLIVKDKGTRRKLFREISVLTSTPKLIELVYEEIAMDVNETDEHKMNAILVQAWQHFANTLARFTAVILKAPSNCYWCTSDNPVIVHQLGKGGWLIGTEAEVYFPISPEFLLYMHVEGVEKRSELATYKKNRVTEIHCEFVSKIVHDIIISSNPEYFIMGEDLGHYNAQTGEFQKRHRPIRN